MIHSKARRRQLILSWLGIGLGWGASLGVGFVLLTEWLAIVVPASTAGALSVGAIITRRLTAPEKRASILVGDLRPAKPQRAARFRR